MSPVGVFVGLTVLDIVSRVDTYPRSNEKVTATHQEAVAGGPAANAAVTFAALGGRAILVTAVGDTAFARVALDDLQRHGVEVIDCAPPGYAISASSVTVTAGSGDRAVVSTDAGKPAPSDNEYRTQETAISEALEKSDVVLVDGHHPELARCVLDDVREAAPGISVIVDAGRWKPQFEWILPQADVVVASEDFEDSHGWVPRELNAQSRLNCLVVRTRGEKYVQWWHTNSSGEIEVSNVVAVDTLGAGDVFHGAFSFKWAEANNKSQISRAVSSTVDFSNKVTARKIQQLGQREWLRDLSGGN